MTATKKNAVPTTAGEKLPMPCVGCHALLHDTAPADHFDQLQEQSRARYRSQCLVAPPGSKPCQKNEPQATSEPPVSTDRLAFRVEDAVAKLRFAMCAYEGIEYMISCADDTALPQPEKLGGIIRAINESAASHLEAIDSALVGLRTALKAASAAAEQAEA